MKIEFIPCNSTNYSKGRSSGISYLVLHYTANDGDTAQGNCKYFAGPNRGASAHYFVDENGVCQSVPEAYTAWHCGAARYKHPLCRNHNSIGIEMCSRKDAFGTYFIKEETVSHAAELVRALMENYQIPTDRVLRHYDVTGKECPRPWVRDETIWKAFLEGLQEEDPMTYELWKEYMERYETELAAQQPLWGKEQWDAATKKKIIDGSRPMSLMNRLEYAVSEMRRLEAGNG